MADTLAISRALTVIMRPQRGREEADACVARIDEGQQVVNDPPELFLHRLRLAVARDPSLAEKIEVVYDDGKTVRPVGLLFEDEGTWPAGFLSEGWDEEIAIKTARQEHAALRRLPHKSEKR